MAGVGPEPSPQSTVAWCVSFTPGSANAAVSSTVEPAWTGPLPPSTVVATDPIVAGTSTTWTVSGLAASAAVFDPEP